MKEFSNIKIFKSNCLYDVLLSIKNNVKWINLSRNKNHIGSIISSIVRLSYRSLMAQKEYYY